MNPITVIIPHRDRPAHLATTLEAVLALGVPLVSGSIESAARFGVLAFPLAWPAGRWLADGDDRRRRWAAAAAAAVTVVMVAQLRLRAP